MNIVSSKSISISEVKEILEKRKKKEELAYEQQQSFEHAEKCSKHSSKDAQKLAKSIIEKNEKIVETTAVKIVDIMPQHVETLKAIFVKDKIVLSDEEVNDVFKVLHS